MTEHTPIAKLKRSIMKQKGIAGFEPKTKELITPDQLPTPYHRTRHMLYLELKFKLSIQELIYQGTIYETADKLGTDPTTISKWRKIISGTRR